MKTRIVRRYLCNNCISILGSTVYIVRSKYLNHHLVLFGFAPHFLFISQDLAQVRTPPNVKMISMAPAELAWMLAGVVYPADADEYPEQYVSDFRLALNGRLTELQTNPRNARAMAARFIQTLLSKVRSRLGGFRVFAASIG